MTQSEEEGKLSEELADSIKRAQEILDILKPLVDEGENYKDIFKNIKNDIEGARTDISASKRLNTNYLNDLTKRDNLVSGIITEAESKKAKAEELIKDLEDRTDKAEAISKKIANLFLDSNENKKSITSFKNEAKKLKESIEKLNTDWDGLIEELKSWHKEGKTIYGHLKNRQDEVEEKFNIIDAKYIELFVKKEQWWKSKIDRTDEKIKDISGFHDEIVNLHKPEILKIEGDIAEKSRQINSLLSKSVGWVLDQSYLEAMGNYSTPTRLELDDFEDDFLKNIRIFFVSNLPRAVYNMVIRHFGNLFNYAFFIAPLAIAVAIMTGVGQNEDGSYFTKLIELITNNGKREITVPEIILLKFLISLPLIWISWYGYVNLMQRKRLYEEYNHKSRVMRLYLMFSQEGNHYKLWLMHELEMAVIEAIRKNPAESLDKKWSLIELLLSGMKHEKAIESAKELLTSAASIVLDIRKQEDASVKNDRSVEKFESKNQNKEEIK